MFGFLGQVGNRGERGVEIISGSTIVDVETILVGGVDWDGKSEWVVTVGKFKGIDWSESIWLEWNSTWWQVC